MKRQISWGTQQRLGCFLNTLLEEGSRVLEELNSEKKKIETHIRGLKTFPRSINLYLFVKWIWESLVFRRSTWTTLRERYFNTKRRKWLISLYVKQCHKGRDQLAEGGYAEVLEALYELQKWFESGRCASHWAKCNHVPIDVRIWKIKTLIDELKPFVS